MEAMRDVITHAGSPATYVSYQYSNMDPSAIIIGRFAFAPFTDLHYAPVTNTIRKTRSTAASITYEGIAWSDASKNIYTFSRVPGYDFPFFTVFNDIARVDGGKSKIVALNGTGLGSARQHNRHLTSITLCNMPYPEDDSPIYPDQHDRLPEPRKITCSTGSPSVTPTISPEKPNALSRETDDYTRSSVPAAIIKAGGTPSSLLRATREATGKPEANASRTASSTKRTNAPCRAPYSIRNMRTRSSTPASSTTQPAHALALLALLNHPSLRQTV